MKTAAQLKKILQEIDHKGYPAYKDTRGSYQFDGYVLNIDHVQGDPFASPSKVSLRIAGTTAGIPKELFDAPYKRVALQDHLTRLLHAKIERGGREQREARYAEAGYSGRGRGGREDGGHGRGFATGSGKSGLVSVSRCCQQVLERTACSLNEKTGELLVRMEVGFPASGRTIQSSGLISIFFDFFPDCVEEIFTYARLDKKKVEQVVFLAEDQQYVREQLPKLGLCAFVADGSVLPRESGVSDRPMRQAVAFQSPDTQKVTLSLPHRGELTGMGIRKGITLIVGGGYHGKSTLLEALERGIYNHIAGDGREFVITDASAVKIRAEDGRSVKKTDISLFINNLPNGKNTKAFDTEDASGSTSQAAGMVEAMEAGADLFLIDEDTSATNFMIRDELMQRVIHRDKEPITPFIERVRELYERFGVSTILVAGSCGSYFHIADFILQMDYYVPKDITAQAKAEAEHFPKIEIPKERPEKPQFVRCPQANRALQEGERIKMKTMGRDGFSINRENVDLRYVEQLVDSEQLTALGYYLKFAEAHLFNGKRSLQEAVDELWERTERDGMDFLAEGSYLPAGLARPRRQDIFACFNRYRGLRL